MPRTAFAMGLISAVFLAGCFFASGGHHDAAYECDPGTVRDCGDYDSGEICEQTCGADGWYLNCECRQKVDPTVCMAEGDMCETASSVTGTCFRKAGTYELFCAVECFTVGDACDLGGCYYAEQGNYCFEAGTKVVGKTCGAPAECVVGVQCLDAADYGMFCWQVCVEDTDCTEPAICEDTGLGFSVCVAEEEA
jgi:hypothetical protein